MLRLQKSRLIDATPAEIWDVLGRFMNIDEFSPLITSVDALTSGEDGLGSKRKNHFENGTSLVEEVTEWKSGEGYRVQLSEMDAMPLREASAEIYISSDQGRSKVTCSFDFHVKYGPLGWLMGQTLMKMMMGKIIVGNLKALDERVLAKRVW